MSATAYFLDLDTVIRLAGGDGAGRALAILQLVVAALNESGSPKQADSHQGALPTVQAQRGQQNLNGDPQPKPGDDAVANAECEGHGDHGHECLVCC